MNYAIVKSGKTKLLKVIRLTSRQECEWSHFSVVKEKETKEIKWFYNKEEAMQFLVENFSKELIDPEYINIESNCGEYYVE